MDINQFKPEAYFDLSSFSYKEIFSNVEQVWDVLPRLRGFIESLFEKGKVQGNYKENIYIGEGTVIEEGALLVGPAIIGKNSFIGHASYVREYCLFGDGVHIGHGVEVKHSILLNNATSAHLNYLGDSIIGNRVNVSGGAMMANFRLDKKPVSIRTPNGKMETSLLKLGAIIGDDSTIGVNAVLNPGTLLGRGSHVYPLTSVIGSYPDHSIIKAFKK